MCAGNLRQLSQWASNSFVLKIEELVNWCFEPSQPPGIISELKVTFKKRHIVERTNKTGIRSEEQSEKTYELSGEFKE